MSKIFGYRLRKLRTKKGLLLKDVAKVAKTTTFTISAWELDKQEPSIDKLKILADFFKVSVDYLTGQDNETQMEIYKAKKAIFSFKEYLEQERREDPEYERELELEKQAEEYFYLQDLKENDPMEYVEEMTKRARLKAAAEVGLEDYFNDEEPEPEPDEPEESEDEPAPEDYYYYQEYLDSIELDEETLKRIYDIEPNKYYNIN